MSQVFRYVSPGTFNVDLGNQAVRLGEIPGLVTMAELGGVGTSTVVIDNPDGTVGYASDQIVGWKQLQVTEGAETAGNQRIYTGYITDRHYRRGTGVRASIRTGAGNEIEVNLSDLNALLTFKVITGTDAVRPSETVSARTAWLMASTYLSGLVYDNGFVAASSVVMDATDYTGQQPAAVFADMALATHFNYFVYYDEAAGQASLWFDNTNTSNNWYSGIFISNTLTDIDNDAIVAGTATVFYPMYDAELHRDPTRCYSGVYLPYQKGHVYVTNATIESNFVGRDGSAPNSNVKTAAAATVVANLFLEDNQTEDDRITVTIQVAAAQANCLLAGQLVQFKASHLPGYAGSYNPMRVMQRSLAQSIESDQWYQMQLILSPASPTPPAACSYTAPVNPSIPSSDDTWGAHVTPAGVYYVSATPPTFTIDSNLDPFYLMGTPNVSQPWGLKSGVFGPPPDPIAVRWSYDFGSAVTICVSQLIWFNYGYLCKLQYSDDGATWTSLFNFDGTAQAVNLTHRYWAIYYESAHPSFSYFAGLDLNGWLLWQSV